MLQISINILLVIHVFVSVLMLLVVLMQRPKSEGLGAAFGGGMTENIFGAQTTNVLTKFTVWLGGAFFALTLLLAVLYSKQSTGHSGTASQILAEEAAAETPAVTETAVPESTPTDATLPLDNIAPVASEAPEVPEASEAGNATVPEKAATETPEEPQP